MKWKNKGHELDKHAEYLVKMFEEKQEKIYVLALDYGGEQSPPFLNGTSVLAGILTTIPKSSQTE